MRLFSPTRIATNLETAKAKGRRSFLAELLEWAGPAFILLSIGFVTVAEQHGVPRYLGIAALALGTARSVELILAFASRKGEPRESGDE